MLISSKPTFSYRLEAMKSVRFQTALKDIKHGVEREGLRIKPDGKLAQTGHPASLGSALTHECITTDFSESLLEFITPPVASSEITTTQLKDIHKFTLDNIGEEMLWPLSMPCFINNQDEIPLAYFGESNVGKMKRVYRMGLKNRYGSMMQAISGVHFNFSLPDTFWQAWAELNNTAYSTDQVSADYFALIRNYRRYCWLLPFLYGASPALCGSFLRGKETALPFEHVGKGTVYMPYATSLRMSDLGYTNSEQSALQICYNQLSTYVDKLRSAMYTPSSRFGQFAAGEGGHFQQLSKNILQIENELYSPIRPKQPTASMEKPTDALVRRGVNYVEVRVLDVNPFTPVGIDKQQMDFLDVFMVTCLMLDSPEMDAPELAECRENMDRVVMEGRKPSLVLSQRGQEHHFAAWAEALFVHFRQTAELLDAANGSTEYSEAVDAEWKKVQDPALTPSGRILTYLLENNMDNSEFGLALARQYADQIRAHNYSFYSEADFRSMAASSLAEQVAIESEDEVSFEQFVSDYFAEPTTQKSEE
ncbi:glutamate--cysteine ligase [Aestuariibacter sp. A3R04]|uniref:glutamate--cysteine ligase n=1 Tax=Aestuariibacter sp. A3R04 TaxID=2841571 RepID=UPI001C0A3626|nr:glutamate--cysteine ligase [Aestuariibacter sp. A3R04]MBU3022340.1 glutamate--cysteine ligase [Aestuariibacter sp. A3R04]